MKLSGSRPIGELMDQIIRIMLCVMSLVAISCDPALNHHKDMVSVWEERCYKGYVYVVHFSIYQAGITQLLDAEGKPVPCEVEE